jgi:hypothetical protein
MDGNLLAQENLAFRNMHFAAQDLGGTLAGKAFPAFTKEHPASSVNS